MVLGFSGAERVSRANMGEVVVSSEEVEVKSDSKTERKREETAAENGGGDRKSKKDGLVKWEKFLPRMTLRVLLVEADDSTRQIIAALLRKCSYRVVAVSDGLKAWGILKGRPHNVDLILTEVDLPSISGYALLTLIMEHEICKSIPVIMMSSQDSVSTVYKCMLRGAADYLVKPIRRNELRNLWQHVWRRQASIVGGSGPQDESVGQQKLEATSENNAASNQSSGFLACIQRNKEQIEKGSDAQSSCTKPDAEAEGENTDNMQEFSRLKWTKSLSNDMEMQQCKDYPDFCTTLPVPENEAGGSLAGAYKEVIKASVNEDVGSESQRRDANITDEACNGFASSSKEAIDFMGQFGTHKYSSNNGTSKFELPLPLDLSLRRSHPSDSEDQVSGERPILWHSNASAFTRYTRILKQPQCSTSPSVSNQNRESDSIYEKNLPDLVGGFNCNAPGPPPSTRTSLAIGQSDYQSKQSELATNSWPQQRVFPVPIPVKGIKVNSPNTGYCPGIPPIFGRQSTPSPTPSPSSASQLELTSRANTFCRPGFGSNKCEQMYLYDGMGQNVNSANQFMYNKLESLEDRGHISPATDQSGTSSFCNGAMSHLNSMGYGSACGSNVNVDQVSLVREAPESMNEDGYFSPKGNSQRSLQREAALTKFRQKRKDRCFEKKVRYESRKKLAEQRPRVKGQFVRQVHPEPAPSAAENHYGNSSSG